MTRQRTCSCTARQPSSTTTATHDGHVQLVVCRDEGDSEAGDEVRRDLDTEDSLLVVVEGDVLVFQRPRQQPARRAQDRVGRNTPCTRRAWSARGPHARGGRPGGGGQQQSGQGETWWWSCVEDAWEDDITPAVADMFPATSAASGNRSPKFVGPVGGGHSEPLTGQSPRRTPRTDRRLPGTNQRIDALAAQSSLWPWRNLLPSSPTCADSTRDSARVHIAEGIAT